MRAPVRALLFFQWQLSVQRVYRGGGWRKLCSLTAKSGKFYHNEQNEATQSQDGGHESEQKGRSRNKSVFLKN